MKKGVSHTDQLHRLKRIEGQVRGISKMVEEKRYCMDILTQIKAIKSALSSVEGKIIEEHLDHCVHEALASKSKADTTEKLNEIKQLLSSVKR